MLMFRVRIAPEGESFPEKLKHDFEAENKYTVLYSNYGYLFFVKNIFTIPSFKKEQT